MLIILGDFISFKHNKIAKGAKHNRKLLKIPKLSLELFQTLITLQTIDLERNHPLKEMNHKAFRNQYLLLE